MTEQPSKRARRPRRRALRVLLLAVFLLLFFLWQENSIQTERIEVTSPRLPASFEGFTIVQLSDVHNKEFGADNGRLLAAVAAQDPDLIAITGDLVSKDGDLRFVPALAKGLAAIAPTYYVTGNHEWASGELWALRPLLRECGVTVLSNEFVTLERGGETVVLAGVEDPNGRADQTTPEELCARIRDRYGDSYTILLAHRNNLWQLYERCGADLVLSGHAHGGIIRLPFTDGLIGPSREFLPSHTAGLYPLAGGASQVVSRGMGGPRLFNRPHLPVVVLGSEP